MFQRSDDVMLGTNGLGESGRRWKTAEMLSFPKAVSMTVLFSTAGDEDEGQVVFNKIKSEPVSRHCDVALGGCGVCHRNGGLQDFNPEFP